MIVVIVILAVFAAFVLVSNLMTWFGFVFTVQGESMEPTLRDKDMVLVAPVRKPKRYDIVVFTDGKKPYFRTEKWMEKHGKMTVVKRIIGLPNETVQIKNGRVYINDERLADDVVEKYILHAGLARKQIKLKDDEYFVLGDNRNNATDSRDFGAVPRKAIWRRVIREFETRADNIGRKKDPPAKP